MKSTAWTSTKVLYIAYCQFCEDTGELPLSKNAMTSTLKTLDYNDRKRSGARGWCGIQLRNECDDFDFPKETGVNVFEEISRRASNLNKPLTPVVFEATRPKEDVYVN